MSVQTYFGNTQSVTKIEPRVFPRIPYFIVNGLRLGVKWCLELVLIWVGSLSEFPLREACFILLSVEAPCLSSLIALSVRGALVAIPHIAPYAGYLVIPLPTP